MNHRWTQTRSTEMRKRGVKKIKKVLQRMNVWKQKKPLSHDGENVIKKKWKRKDDTTTARG